MKRPCRRDFVAAEAHAGLTTGAVIRMLRDLKGWTQQELARRSRISATNISLLEHERAQIGKHRALLLADAFGVHPAIIMFPEYEAKAIGEAA